MKVLGFWCFLDLRFYKIGLDFGDWFVVVVCVEMLGFRYGVLQYWILEIGFRSCVENVGF